MILKTRYQGKGTELQDGFFTPENKQAAIDHLATVIWVAACSYAFTPAYRESRDIYAELERRDLLDWYQAAFTQARAKE